MGARQWQEGIGGYLINRTAYAVVNDAGSRFLQFTNGQRINGTTYVVQRGQDLVIVRDGKNGATWDILVLVDEQHGWWRPKPPFFRPEAISNKAARSTVVAPAHQPAPDRSVFRGNVLAAVQAVLDCHDVYVGPAGSLLLAQYGRFRGPYDTNRLFKGQLAPGAELRREVIDLARAVAGTWVFDEVPLKLFNPKASVQCPQVLESPKWLLVCGDQQTPILPKESAVRVNVSDHKKRGAPMAVNGSRCRDWDKVLGTFRVQRDSVYPAGELTVLVQCTPCSSRTFVVLVATNQGPTLVQYAIERNISGKVTVGDMRQQSEPHYVLAYDATGRVRCFRMPV